MKLAATIWMFCVVAGTPVYAASPRAHHPPDVFRFDMYGKLRWEDETARLDNFAIQILNEPGVVGYIYVEAGTRSCRGEAVSHALKARKYLLEVRQLPWHRVAFRDIGYSDEFRVTLWLFPAGNPPRYFPEYQPPTTTHVIKSCGSRATDQHKSLRIRKKIRVIRG